jgi:hypothetical protein
MVNMLHFLLLQGIGGNDGTVGYRGVGYNPNFIHADEYPPSQEHVQTQKEPIDLSKHISMAIVCFSNIQYFVFSNYSVQCIQMLCRTRRQERSTVQMRSDTYMLRSLPVKW